METYQHPNFTYRFNPALFQTCLALDAHNGSKAGGGGVGEADHDLVTTDINATADNWNLFFLALCLAFTMCLVRPER